MAGVPVSESELDEVSEELVESESEELAGELAGELAETEEFAGAPVEDSGNCVFGFALAMSSPVMVNDDVKSASLIK